MCQSSFGLIVANRAVVLGVLKARDIIDLTVEGERSGAFDAVCRGIRGRTDKGTRIRGRRG